MSECQGEGKGDHTSEVKGENKGKNMFEGGQESRSVGESHPALKVGRKTGLKREVEDRGYGYGYCSE